MKKYIRVFSFLIILMFSSTLFASMKDDMTPSGVRSAIFPGIWASDGSWDGVISLHWTTVAGADTYQVYRSTTPSSLGTLIYTTNAAGSYLDYDITVNVTYYYQLLVCSVSMCIYHEGYDDGYAAPVTTPSPPPSYLNASDGDYYDKVILDWEIMYGALYYKLYRSSSADQVGGLIYQSGNRIENEYIDTTVTPGVTHYYRIQSCVSGSCSGYGAVESGYAKEIPAPPPSYLNASDGDYSDKVYLEWPLVANAKYYKLYRSAAADQVGGLIYQSASNTNVSYFDTTVTPGVTHYYRIQSCITGSCSGYGSVESGFASASVSASVAALLANKTWTVSGYFIHYTSEAFDWLYVTPNASLVAKLKGMDESNGKLIWKIVQTTGTTAFDSVAAFTIQLDYTVGTSVLFGNYIGNDPEVNTLGALLQNQLIHIDGYFIHYGSGAYDWVYLSQDKTLVAKLDGMNPQTNYFNWTILQQGSNTIFSSIDIINSGKQISFGVLK